MKAADIILIARGVAGKTGCFPGLWNCNSPSRSGATGASDRPGVRHAPCSIHLRHLRGLPDGVSKLPGKIRIGKVRDQKNTALHPHRLAFGLVGALDLVPAALVFPPSGSRSPPVPRGRSEESFALFEIG